VPVGVELVQEPEPISLTNMMNQLVVLDKRRVLPLAEAGGGLQLHLFHLRKYRFHNLYLVYWLPARWPPPLLLPLIQCSKMMFSSKMSLFGPPKLSSTQEERPKS